MIVVVHQDDGVRLAADGGIVITGIGRRQSHHQLQIGAMQPGSQFADKGRKIALAPVRNLLKVERHARLVGVHHARHNGLHQALPRRRVVQHLGHLPHVPDRAVGVVQQRHRGNFHAHRLHPRGKFWIAFVIEPSIRGNRVQLFGHQQVNVAIVLLQRGETRGVIANVKRDSQRGVIYRRLAQRGDPQPSPAARGCRGGRSFRFGDQGAAAGPCAGQQKFRQVHPFDDRQKKHHQDDREHGPGDFQ